MAITLPVKAGAVREAVTAVRGWPAMPMAIEVLSPTTATALGLGAATTLLVRMGGNPRLTAAMKKRAGAIGKTTTVEAEIWTRLRALDLEAPVSFRISDLPTAFAERWDDAITLAGSEGRVVGSPFRGQVRCMLPSVERATMTGFRARVKTATLVYDSLPSVATWNSLTSVPASSTLHARIIDAFDPVGVMNPGAMRLAR